MKLERKWSRSFSFGGDSEVVAISLVEVLGVVLLLRTLARSEAYRCRGFGAAHMAFHQVVWHRYSSRSSAVTGSA